MRLSLVALFLVVLTASGAAAHDDEARLRGLDAALARAGGSAALLMQRAEIERAEGRWASAESDLARAAKIAPGSAALARCRAALALDRGEPEAALVAVRACTDPERARDPRLPWLEAEALARLGRCDEAARIMDAAIAAGHGATAERYLERAALAEHRRDEGMLGALATLEAGLARWPRAWILVTRAIDIDVALERFDSALARIDAEIPSAQRPEALLARRGDVLALAGRPLPAREAWTAALAALESRPTPDAETRRLVQQLHTSLAAPNATVGAP